MPKNYTGVDTSYPANVPIPRDGERVNEHNWGPAWMRLADRAAWIKRQLPLNYAHIYDTLGGTAWTYPNTAVLANSISAGHYVDVPSTRVGDKIVVTTSFISVRTWGVSGAAAHPFDLYLDAIDDATGTPTAEAHIPGAHWAAGLGVPFGSAATVSTSLAGTWTVTKAGTTRIALAFLSGAGWSNAGAGAGDTFAANNTLTIVATFYAGS